MNIELVLPPAELRDWRTRKEGQEVFDRGERIIMVDGVRWGRTVVTWHGYHGTKTTFVQEQGEKITRLNGNGRIFDEVVNSASERYAKKFIDGEYRLPDDFKPTDQLVLEKVQQLVAVGKLRHPSVVKAERAKLGDELDRRRAERTAQEEQEFRQRAAEALRANDLDSEMVTRVVEAMRWAQSQ